ncbi:Von Willebrand factor A domain-containing protein [Actinidia chinensis var. chinensis]|uniref:von Willebrand factor A domain-containing protein n=1 Tax=Actinidia chinensis var. chinensis TaxID=1590841 RepID=A0A2R6PTT9_ACTCC|nr:Von Willebrand factor A domain-containing protein [Actinidia chinensis var. chinensis]
MAYVQLTNVNGKILCKKGAISLLGFSSDLPLSIPRVRAIEERAISQSLSTKETTFLFSRKRSYNMTSKKVNLTIPRCSSPSNSTGSRDEPSDQTKTPFGYTRNAQQLRDYESKVMEKRLEGLTEAELEALLEQVEEEKRRLASGEQVN